MRPRLDISFPLKRQWQYWFGKEHEPCVGEYLLDHARTGIVMALRATLPNGGRVGVVAYNCHTVANAVVSAGCTPVFVDVTESLTIDVNSVPSDLDAIVVTNLFGIRNDVEAIRKCCPKAIIIMDNAHGYGLPAEGDFTVYSINQGKFPALGEGGILIESEAWRGKSGIGAMYAALRKYGIVAQVKLFVSMQVKALLYQPWLYGWLTRRLKQGRTIKANHSAVTGMQMAPGIRRLYHAFLPQAETIIAKQLRDAELVGKLVSGLGDVIVGDNAFMLVVRTTDAAGVKELFAKRGVEVETHFAHAIDWAKEFGYHDGACPQAEQLTNELIMIPTYTRI